MRHRIEELHLLHVQRGVVDGVEEVAEQHPVPEGVGEVLHRGVGPGDPAGG